MKYYYPNKESFQYSSGVVFTLYCLHIFLVASCLNDYTFIPTDLSVIFLISLKDKTLWHHNSIPCCLLECHLKCDCVASGTAFSEGRVVKAEGSVSITSTRTGGWTHQTEKPVVATPCFTNWRWTGVSSTHVDADVSPETELTGDSHHGEECSAASAREGWGQSILSFIFSRVADS